MDNTVMEALTSFNTTVTSTVSVTQMLTILGLAVGAGLIFYSARWGAKLIVKKFKQGLNGKISG